MSLCLRNFTIGIFSRMNERDIKIETNQTITGRVGKYMSRLLIGKNQKNCTLRRVLYLKESPGIPTKNASVVYLMEKKEIDFYSYPIDLAHATDERVIETTKPFVFSP